MSNLLRFPHLHSLIYVIADKPTKDNISAQVPLVGTQSYKTFLSWVGEMDIDITRIRLFNQVDDPFGNAMSKFTLNQAVKLGQIKVIALGQKAATYLNKVGIEEYYLLPHPSLRNRILNDQELVKQKLASCKTYIYKGTIYGEQECAQGVEKDILPESKFPPKPESNGLGEIS